MKILIIRFSSMGDVILTAPLFSALKSNYPEARITFITRSQYTDFFRDDPRVEAVVPYFRDDEEKVFARVSQEKWDLIIDLQNNRRTRRLRKKYFAHFQQGIFNKLHLKRVLLLYARLDLYKKNGTVVQRYLHAAGISFEEKKKLPDLKLYFDFSSAQKHRVFQNDSAKIIALFPFSAWKNKQWPAESYVEVGKHFVRKKWHVAIIGGPEDAAAAEELRSEIGENCYSFAGSLTLYEIGCFLSQCLLSLGGDTGLSHLARACGVKTGFIYGATTRHFGFFPYGDPSYAVFESKQLCRPCHPHGGNMCWRVSRPCLKEITAHEVIAELKSLSQ